MYNERHKILPPLPTATAYININGVWAQTTSGEPFLLADDDTNRRILIFTTHKNLAHFATADTIYGDGTFYFCPSLFYQLCTFHAIVDGNMYPLVYSLLPAKSLHKVTHTTQRTMSTTSTNQNYNPQLSSLTMKQPLGTQHIQFFQTSAQKVVSSTMYSAYGEKWKTLVFKYPTKRTTTQTSQYAELQCSHYYLPMTQKMYEDLEEADTNTPTLAFTDYVTSYWVESNRHL